MNKNTLLGERLKKIRTQRNFRQKDIAAAVGVSVSTYSLYETGSRTPSIHKLAQIAQALRVSTDELLGLPPQPAHLSSAVPPKALEELSQYAPEDIEVISWIFSSARRTPPRVTMQLCKLYLSLDLPFRLDIAERMLQRYRKMQEKHTADTQTSIDLHFLERSLHLVRSYAELQNSSQSCTNVENNS